MSEYDISWIVPVAAIAAYSYHLYLRHRERMAAIAQGVPLPVDSESGKKLPSQLAGYILAGLGGGMTAVGALALLWRDKAFGLLVVALAGSSGLICLGLGVGLILYCRNRTEAAR